MEFKARATPQIKFNLDGSIEVCLVTTEKIIDELESYNGKELSVKITPYSKKRSLSQNAYMWVLLDKVAKKLNTSKETIYKNLIKDYGVFEILPIKNEAVERFIKNWSKNGIGWFCDDIGESKLHGFTKLIAYYGSSTYNSVEMSRVVNALVQECSQLEISTMSLTDIMELSNENDSL